jgi:dTDP-3-amino-2,3,6-trideoxy-4-keto-D-glucose/dTDP-3-amino-3,4,6-trideoxy-alpha-D-glucose/dTDP-2,6-dideoxy-D-kanosamine transaminase
MKVNYSYLVDQFSMGGKEPKVKYIDLPKQAHAADMLNDIKELLLKSGQFTLGPQVGEFETRFAKFCGVPHAVGCASGTDALFLSLKVLNIGPGDEVITVPNTFVATVASIVNVGAKPVFVDVAPDYNVDTSLIEKAITKKTKAIIPVHLTGNPADMPAILAIAKKHKLHVIEDGAQAVCATIDGKSIGTFGDTGCFSFHPLKNLNVWGDGGMIVTNSKDIAAKLLLWRNHGLSNRDECEFFAYNSRLDTLQAIVANRLMNDLDEITDTRIKNAAFYDKALAKFQGKIIIPPRKKGFKQVYHTYVVRAVDRNGLYKHLLDNGVEAKIHYPVPLHVQEAAKSLGYKEGDFPACEAQAKSIITLPVHQHLTKDQLAYVVDVIGNFYRM